MRATFLVLLLIVAGRSAAADDRATAREHYRRGMKAYDLGHYGDAVKEFEAAYSAQDDPVLLFNLGQAYRFAGDYASAIRSYKSFLRRVPQNPHRAEVEARITELQKLLDDQNREKERPPSGAIAPQPEVSPAPIAAPPPSATRAWPPARPLKIAGLTLAGVGVASVILGGVFAGLAGSAADQASSPSSGVFDPAAEDRMNLYQKLEIGMFVAGGVLVAGGLTAFLVGQLHRPVVEVRPAMGPGRIGATMEAHFQ
jgi:tetratricopeptide (TPR) repeat protein